MWPFSARTFLDPEEEAWQFETWHVFLSGLGGMADLRESDLVLPTKEYFPPTGAKGHERAEYIFECVKKLVGMQDWHCRLIAQPRRPDARLGEFVRLSPVEGSLPLGTFGVDGNEVVITYDPDSTGEPVTLIATFVHELAHYLILSKGIEIPGGAELEEFATDLMTVYLGFGVFGANRAFNFSQFGDSVSMGWQTSGQGYLSERNWIFALAIFLALKGEGIAEAREHLKSHLRKNLAAAITYLGRRRSEILALQAL